MSSEKDQIENGKSKDSKSSKDAINSNSISQKANSLNIKPIETREGVVLITLKGFLQLQEAKQILKEVNSLQDEGMTTVVFDMSGVEYANSTAIGAFVNCASALKAIGGRAVLLSMKSNIKKIFDTLGLLGLFSLASSMDEALEES